MMNLFFRRLTLVAIILSPVVLLLLVLVRFDGHGGALWLCANVVAAGDQVFGAWSIFPPLISWMLTGFVAGALVYFAFYESFRIGGPVVRNVCVALAVVFLVAGAVAWPQVEWRTGGRMLLRPGASLHAGDVKDIGGIDFMWVPPGKFLMGSPDGEVGRKEDEAQHLVTLTRGFWLGKCEVTQAQWREYMDTNPSEFSGDNLPVQNVTWDDTQQFIERVGAFTKRDVRLPTEAEWEYACRAGGVTAFSCGEMKEDLEGCGWFADSAAQGPHPVGQKNPNDWGLHDMHGNVFEWCADYYGPYGEAREFDPEGPATGQHHVLRGGGWSSYAEDCRCARRCVLVEGYFQPKNDIGLRLVVEE